MSIIGTRAFLLSSFLLASGIPLLVFWAWPHSAALDHKLEEVQERHLLFAKGASTTIRNYHETVLRTFDAVAERLQEGEDIGFAQTMLSRLHFRHLCVVNATTGDVGPTYLVGPVILPDRVPPQMLRQLKVLGDARPPRMTHIQQLRPEGPPGFILARSIGDSIVFAEIGPEFVRGVAEDISFGEQGHAAVVDDFGNLISHPNPLWEQEARNLARLDPVRRMIDGETGVATFFSPAINAEVVAGFAAIDGPGWGIMVPQPIDELRSQAQLLNESALLVFTAGLGFSTLLALFASGHAGLLIARFSSAANRMAKGEEGVRIPPPNCIALLEFEQLRSSFNDMAQEVEQSRARLTKLAQFDALTGLPNKREFLARCQAALADPALAGAKTTILYIDVDRFKSVNDIYGHAIGDKVLDRIGQRLQENLHGPDIVARQSGDEFLVFHAHDPSEPDFLRDLQTCLSQPVIVDGYHIPLTCSIGVAALPGQTTDLEAFLNRADKAMYRAKRQGDGSLHVFGTDVQAEYELHEHLLMELKRDVLDGRIDVAFQPILDRSTGQVFGFETLARWCTRDGTRVSPDRFIGLAEEGGVIAQLGVLVRRKAFDFAGRLVRIGAGLPVAVNVSRAELTSRDFVEQLRDDHQAAGLPPENVIVEVTESVFEDRSGHVATTLGRLKDLGIDLWLDDFGKGFSSHGLLMNYHFDALKIDASFMGSFEQDLRARAIIASLVDLANRLGMPVTLEGLETDAEVELADTMAIDRYQGFAFHKPLSGDEAFALIRSLPSAHNGTAAE